MEFVAVQKIAPSKTQTGQCCQASHTIFANRQGNKVATEQE
jgi:hypothetical protein